MLVRLTMLLMLAGMTLPLVAQETPSAPPLKTVRLPKGSVVPVALAHGVSGKTARTGDRVILRVIAPVSHRGVLVIPEGAQVEGLVAAVVAPGGFGRPGRIDVEAVAVILETGRIRLEGALARQGRDDRPSARQGVVSVPLGALSKGKSVSLDAGTIFVATTARDY